MVEFLTVAITGIIMIVEAIGFILVIDWGLFAFKVN